MTVTAQAAEIVSQTHRLAGAVCAWAPAPAGYTPLTPAPLDRITCPTLIVHAHSDKAVPPASAEYAHAHITGSELYWMDGSHVAFALEAADTAPESVLNWLRHD